VPVAAHVDRVPTAIPVRGEVFSSDARRILAGGANKGHVTRLLAAGHWTVAQEAEVTG
jgi:hypothetical protein